MAEAGTLAAAMAEIESAKPNAAEVKVRMNITLSLRPSLGLFTLGGE
jgi:hypothetical protein